MKIINKKIKEVVEEAARLLRENPDWTYKKAIDTARDIYMEKERR